MTCIGSVVVLILCLTNPSKNLAFKLIRGWATFLIWLCPVDLHVDASSAPLQRDQSYVFLSNHQSQLDIPILLTALSPVNLCFVAKKSLFRIPLFGWAMRAVGCVPVDRKNWRKGLRSLKQAAKKSHAGRSLLVFPEGNRGTTLREFKIGGIILALETGLPIVPIVIEGTAAIVPRKKLLLHKGAVQVTLLEPIDTKERYTLKKREELRDMIWKRMNQALRKQK